MLYEVITMSRVAITGFRDLPMPDPIEPPDRLQIDDGSEGIV